MHVKGFNAGQAVFLAKSDTVWLRKGSAVAAVSAFLLDVGEQRTRASAALLELAKTARRRL